MLNNFFFLFFFILSIGFFGIFLLKKNFIIILLCIEIMLLALNLNFIFLSIYLDDITSQIYAFIILTLAAAESALGLTLLILYYRFRYNKMSIDFLNIIRL